MTERFWLMTAVVFAIFFADWLTVGFSWRKAEYILKPAAMAMVILWTCFTAGWTFEVLLILFILGQTAGLAGDIFLMLSPRWFLAGLASFLVGHLFYIGLIGRQIITATREFGLNHYAAWWMVLIIIIWAVMLRLFYRIVIPEAPRLKMLRYFWILVQVYAWILGILVMVSFLLVTIPANYSPAMLFLPAGALLF
ncbi:MAG: lysoplasmalogenase family protein, partial [Brevefilum fermentans]